MVEDLIELKLNEGLYKQAAKEQQKLIAMTKTGFKSATQKLRLGQIYEMSGQNADALKLYQELMKVVKGESWIEKEILARFSHIYKLQGKSLELPAFFHKLTTAYPKRISLLKKYAESLQQSGKNQEALKTYSQVIALTPGNRLNKEYYITLLSRVGKYAEASQSFNDLITHYPSDKELLIRLASLEYAAGQKEKTVAAFTRFIKADTTEFALLRAARMLKSFRMVAEAEKFYDQLLSQYPASEAGKEGKAEFLFARKEKELAVKLIMSMIVPGKKDTILRTATTLSRFRQHKSAYKLLKTHNDNTIPLLNSLYKTATILNHKKDMKQWAQARMTNAVSFNDFRTAAEDYSSASHTLGESHLLRTRLHKNNKSEADYCLLSLLESRQSDPEMANRVIIEGLKKYPKSLYLYGFLAITSRQAKDWESAIKAHKKLITLEPRLRTAHIKRLIETCIAGEKYQEGLKWVREWKRKSANQSAPYLEEARLLKSWDKPDQALKVLRDASRKFASDVPVAEQFTYSCIASGRNAEAERQLWKLYDICNAEDRRMGYLRTLADVMKQRGRQERLIRYFEEQRKADSKALFPIMALAGICHQLERPMERRRYLQLASQIKDDDPALLYEIANLEESEGEYQSMRLTLEKAARVDPTPARANKKLLEWHLKHGNVEDARQLLGGLLSGGQVKAEACLKFASKMINDGEFRQCEQLLIEARKQYPGDFYLHYYYAISLEEQDRKEEAIEEFLGLLKYKKHAEKSSNHSNFSYYNGGGSLDLSSLSGLLPTGIWNFCRQQRMTSSLYSYRNSQYNNYYSSQQIRSPQSKEELKYFAVGHLSTLSADSSPEVRAKVVSAFKNAGVKYPELILAMEADFQFDNVDWVQVRKRYKGDEVIELLYYINCVVEETVTTSKVKAAFEYFKEKRPQLAIAAVLGGLTYEAGNRKLTASALSLLEKSKDLQFSLFFKLATQLADGEFLPVDQEKQLTSILKKHFIAFHRNNRSGSTSFLSFFKLYHQTFSEVEMVSLFEQECENVAQNKKNNNHSSHYYGGYYGHRSGFTLPDFPPEKCPSIPAHLQSILKVDDPDDDEHDRFNSYGNQEPAVPDFSPNKKKLWAASENVKPAMLKLLLAHYCGQKETTGELIEVLLAKHKDDLDTVMLSASWFIRQGKYPRAMKLLAGSRFKSISKEERQRIDMILTTLATSSGDRKLFEEGKKAALRLVRGQLSNSQKNELAEHFTTLGLDAESEKLTSKTPKSNSSYNHYSNDYFEKGEKLLEDGKDDEAVKSIAKDLRRMAPAVFKEPSDLDSSSWRWHSISWKLRNNKKAKKKLIEVIKGGDTPTLRQQKELALLYRILEEEKEASKLLAQLYKKHPQDNYIACGYLIGLAKSEPETFYKDVEALNSKQSQTVLTMIVERDYSATTEHKFNRVKCILKLFSKLSPIDRTKAGDNLASMVETLVEPGNALSPAVPHLFAKSMAKLKIKDSKSKSAKFAKQRKELFLRMTVEFGKHADLAEKMLKFRLRAALASGEDYLPLYDQAVAALGAKKAVVQPQRHYYSHGFYYGIEKVEMARKMGLEEFIVYAAFQKGKEDRLEKTISSLGQKCSGKVLKTITDIKTLYSSPEPQFKQAVRSLLNIPKKIRRSSSGLSLKSIPVRAQWCTQIRLRFWGI